MIASTSAAALRAPRSRTPFVAALLLAVGARAASPQTGTLVGRVTDARTGAPVTVAHVYVPGTRLGTTVDTSGRFRLTNVPVVAHAAIARGIGFRPSTATFSLAPDDSATVVFSMAESIAALDAVVVTGSVGDTRRRAVGHSVAVVNASDVVRQSAVANVTEVLQARTPGLTLMPGSGTVGTAANYRLRGTGSLLASNAPTIYVDGTRVTARSQGAYGERFGQSTTGLDAINPADVASIEVIKGPAAATLYGAEAAAGVIQIFTKRGRPGRIAWDARLETGLSDWRAGLRPVNYAAATPQRLADTLTWPGFVGKAPGDLLAVRALTEGPALRVARLSKLMVSASGGADGFTFFASTGRTREEGVQYNNFSDLASARGTVTLVPSRALTVTTGVALARNHVRLPLNDNAGPLGLVSSAFLAEPGRRYPVPGGPNYATMTPEFANLYDDQARSDRLTLGSTVVYAPAAWLRQTVHVGLDANVGRVEMYFAPDARPLYVARATFNVDNTRGYIAEGSPTERDATLGYDATATHQLSSRLVSTSSVGAQYLATVYRRTDAFGAGLGTAGLRTVAAAAVTSAVDTSSEQKSLGLYAQEQLALDDRLFVTVAARMDNNSAFGARLRRVLYPKASVSYVISDAPFFHVPTVSALRLRAAWGQAGNAPAPFDAFRSYTASVVTTATGTESALRYAAAGNPDLRPERGSEIEVGVEGAFFGDRVALDASYYRKTTHDALMTLPVPPSTGFTGNQLVNLGTIRNTGMEAQLRASPVRQQSLTVDATLTLAAHRNVLVAFGDGREPIVFGFSANSQRHQEGYPLGGLWAQRVLRNASGALVKVNGRPVLDSGSVYVGPSVPTREMSLAGDVVLLGRLRISALADYKGGHFQYNQKQQRRDRAGVSWEVVNPAADPDEVLVRTFASQTLLYIQPADFLKLRDVSLGLEVPARALHGVARRVTLTLAGHNLRTWTRYGGPDPELNYGGARTFNRDDLWTVPQTRRFSAALAVGF